jgi:exodeoxyribonuclease VII small subunit
LKEKEALDEASPESFESAMEQLETLVSRMESGDLSLEESLKAFERGVYLTRFCQDQLQKAELKIQELNSKGEFTEIDQENEPR